MYFISEESNFALTSWGACVGLYQHLALTILGGHCASFVPALMQIGTYLLLEHQCKLRQACSMLSTHRSLTAVLRTSQALVWGHCHHNSTNHMELEACFPHVAFNPSQVWFPLQMQQLRPSWGPLFSLTHSHRLVNAIYFNFPAEMSTLYCCDITKGLLQPPQLPPQLLPLCACLAYSACFHQSYINPLSRSPSFTNMFSTLLHQCWGFLNRKSPLSRD